MEFPDLGKNCSNPNCKQLDFLPVVCDSCNKVFCITHYPYESHSCPNSFQRDNQVPVCPLCNQPVPLRKGESPDIRVNSHIEDECQDGRAVRKRSTIYKNRCSFEKCKKKELIPITCDVCRKNFCLKHRNPLDHKCTTRENKPNGSNTGNWSNWSNLSKSGEAALRRIQAATSSVTNSTFGHSENRTSGIANQQKSSSRVKSVQGDYTEDEALAWALQQSLNDQSSRAALRGSTRSNRTNETSDFARSKDKCSVT
ncbi:LOW QUALITY PROTEIN: AN1-type zinc finger protein 2A-like [Panonychus citri]|uniref:LOW QUALITY PROTEIN: AN1-type zinc finger protein 2A-like n=1 Tax=Panonychus citri TaxID=50023 RepID=UPI002307D34C|nr:LOW QUALITY PROTEIN: AN1-type zinc finger protein 2A-like [Panonychus citri]